MKTFKLILSPSLALVSIFTSVAHAAEWSICKLDVLVMNKIRTSYLELQAEILTVYPVSKNAECPLKGEIITYRPEDSDYQSEL